jgi:hypothetical protein
MSITFMSKIFLVFMMLTYAPPIKAS